MSKGRFKFKRGRIICIISPFGDYDINYINKVDRVGFEYEIIILDSINTNLIGKRQKLYVTFVDSFGELWEEVVSSVGEVAHDEKR